MKQLRVFWLKAFAYVPKEKWSKLDLRTVQGISLGYALGCKQYRILDPKKQSIKMCSVDKEERIQNCKKCRYFGIYTDGRKKCSSQKQCY